MWVMSAVGFFSVVAASKEGDVMIRARRRKDLEDLLAIFGTPKQRRKILRTPDADYLYRVVVKASTWAKWAGQLAFDAARYPNFKAEIGRRNKHRASVYAQVWGDLLAIESEEPVYRRRYGS